MAELDKVLRNLIEPMVDEPESLEVRVMPSENERDVVLCVYAKNDDIARLIQQGEASQLDIEKLRVLTLEQGGIEYAVSVIKDYADRAHQLIDGFPPSVVKSSLHDYVEFVCERGV